MTAGETGRSRTGRVSSAVEPVAVVGVSCRLPQAADPGRFWQLLRDGVDAVTAVPEGRWPDESAAAYRRGGFLSDVDRFDAAFFGISPNEAAAMDPQQRLVLELAWEALESARLVPGRLSGSGAGVFLGAISNDYAALQDRVGGLGRHAYTGANRAMIANRVSYFLGLRGPSLTLDAGQSSSLLAVQMACESLRRGETGLALAGGVNLNLLAETTAAIGDFGALSPDGRCYVFDGRANGYVRGEGGALVVLKPLSAALADGDPIRCVILGGAVNNDGGGDGLTVPSRRAQEEVIRLACERAGVEPGDVQYVELHGTGTKVGDPIEAAALGAAYGPDHADDESPLLVGSVKTNIGHLEGAAGIAGLVKVVLSLEQRELPPSLNFETANPDIPLDELGLEVVRDTRPWPRADRPLIAGVSSFGMGGTNCHLVLGEAPRSGYGVRSVSEDTPWVLSARSARALGAQAERLLAHVGPPVGPADVEAGAVALALLRSRAVFEHRAVLLGADRQAGLAALAAGRLDESVVTGSVVAGSVTGGRRVFVFPGQGSQWPEMARDLLAGSPVFAAHAEACAGALEPFVDYALLDVLRGAPGAPGLDRVDVVQPALWAVMVSLAGLWRSYGVEPEMVIGHSQGEIAAATVVGALSMPDAARVVALRSRAIAGIAGRGGMMSIAAPLDVVESAIRSLTGDVSIAAYNGPRSVVVSGRLEALDDLGRRLTDDGYRTRIIPVDYASHSAEVEEIRDEVLAALAPVRPVSAGTLFISTLTGEPIDTAELDAGYWYRSLRQPVRFAQATRRALDHQGGLFVECSPHPVLGAGIEETTEEADREAAVIGTLRRGEGGLTRFRRSLAEAYTRGAEVDWTGPDPVAGAELVELPTYAFQRERHWPSLPAAARRPTARTVGGDARRSTARTVGGDARRSTAQTLPRDARRSTEQTVPAGGGLSRREVRELVLTLLAGLLGYEDAAGVEPGRTFKDLGLESATAEDLRHRLRSATGLRLPTSLLFDHPTPDLLIAHLRTLLDDGGSAASTANHQSDPATPRLLDDASADDFVGDTDGGLNGDPDAIAIVAMGCRYPGGADSPEELWRLVSTGTDAITEFPVNRGWDLDALFAAGPDRSGTSDTRYGGFLHDADRFDAAFFGISPREATAMDPQQRLLMEVSWEAVERAGLDPAGLRGSATGVFVGAMASDYGPRLHQATGTVDGHLLTGTALSVASGRIAYALGLRGPAITADTACSSSLVAIFLAMQALRRGECSLALAGGATVMSSPGIFVEFSRQSGLAADGRCKAFAAGADGTGWGEGAGMLLLERLSDARRLGHPVLAVIRGGAVNQDGASNGLTAPNGQAQQEVIRQALADAGLAAAEVDAVEAHGTGTRLGDPIEAESIIAAYGADRDPGRPVWLGSLKSNIGHTQAAAGVGGVIKMVMAMRHGTLPRTLHADEPTPHVDWSGGAVRLLTEPVELPDDRPTRAAVSSFGISGTNAHLILEQAPETAHTVPETGSAAPKTGRAEPESAYAAPETARAEAETAEAPLVWAVSAKSAAALEAHAARLRDYATDAPQDDLAAAGHLLARRARFAHRAVVVAADRDELVAALAALAAGESHAAVTSGTALPDIRPVFVFPGQGSQWTGMAVDLLDSNEVFSEWMTRCDAALAPYTGWSAVEALRAGELVGSEVIQPVLFAVMVSLAEVWRSLGVDPAAVVGHSQGEIAAACVAGALTLDDAAKVVVLRSQALVKLGGTGGMLAVALPADEVRLEPWADRLWVAVRSGPASTVVAGELDALDEFAAACGETVRVRKIGIDYASHTPHVEVLRDELLASLAEVAPRPTDVAFCSSMAADFVEPTGLDADYWFRSLRNPVRFEQAIRAVAGDGASLFIEASPHPVLTGHIQDTLAATGAPGGATGTLRRDDGGRRRLLLAVAQAYVSGAEVDWAAVDQAAATQAGLVPNPPRHHVDLPTYPFEHTRYWINESPRAGGPRHPMLDAVVPVAGHDGFLLTGRLSRGALPWLADHAVDGGVLLPGTAFVELALEAAATAGCDEIEDLTLEAPLTLPETGAVQVQLAVGGADAEGRRDLTVYGRTADDDEARWTRHASGTLATGAVVAGERLADWPPVDGVEIDLDDAYERLAERGYEYGPAFQGLRAAWRVDGDAYVEVALPEPIRTDAGLFTLHPALLDAALHLLVLESAEDSGALLLPFAWSGVRVSALGAEVLRVRIAAGDGDRVSLDIHDSAGDRIAGVDALTLRPVPRHGAVTRGPSDAASYTLDWIDLAVSAMDPAEQRWAVVGYDEFADEIGAAVDAPRYYDLASLTEMTVGEMPSTVLVPYLPEADADDVPYGVRDGIYQALDLVQGWVGDERFAGCRMVFVTKGVFRPEGADVAGVVAGPVWGLVRSAQAEHPGRFVLVDVDAATVDWGLVAAAVAAGESQLVARDGKVLVPRLIRRTADAPELFDAGTGTVLVTGGTGSLGALVAHRLVERHGAKDLLLASRRGPEASGDLVARLEALGARVTVAACDVSDRDSLAALLSEVPAERPLVAVVHAAGVLDDATVEGLSAQRLDSVFAPKSDAAWYLHELVPEVPLVTFSSVAGVIGNSGQANYAAANVFLDVLAAHRRGLGLPSVSVAWGLWETADSGMTGALSAADTARLARSGIAPLTAEQGLELFDSAITAPAELVVAARWDTAGLRARAEAGELPPVLRGLVRTARRTAAAANATSASTRAGAAGMAERLAKMAEAEARVHLADMVRSHVAAVLAHGSAVNVDMDRAFNELGFDSLTAVELRNRLNSDTGLRLPATLVFDHPTVTALAEYLFRTLAPAAPSPEDTLRGAVERVESMLTSAHGDAEAIRGKLVAIAQSAVTRFGAGLMTRFGAGSNGAAEKIDSASDEEIFALIDDQTMTSPLRSSLERPDHGD
ncbi:SDR family NAD(P)-dependent oxidoreductase [Nonomuraea sp. CA-143628]|uniref:type I polyketide synthase n=1 Tax=Nonomuraea sp. CA-143628 TaxID=3239997 RepID=UPI003D89F015